MRKESDAYMFLSEELMSAILLKLFDETGKRSIRSLEAALDHYVDREIMKDLHGSKQKACSFYKGKTPTYEVLRSAFHSKGDVMGIVLNNHPYLADLLCFYAFEKDLWESMDYLNLPRESIKLTSSKGEYLSEIQTLNTTQISSEEISEINNVYNECIMAVHKGDVFTTMARYKTLKHLIEKHNIDNQIEKDNLNNLLLWVILTVHNLSTKQKYSEIITNLYFEEWVYYQEDEFPERLEFWFHKYYHYIYFYLQSFVGVKTMIVSSNVKNINFFKHSFSWLFDFFVINQSETNENKEVVSFRYPFRTIEENDYLFDMPVNWKEVCDLNDDDYWKIIYDRLFSEYYKVNVPVLRHRYIIGRIYTNLIPIDTVFGYRHRLPKMAYSFFSEQSEAELANGNCFLLPFDKLESHAQLESDILQAHYMNCIPVFFDTDLKFTNCIHLGTVEGKIPWQFKNINESISFRAKKIFNRLFNVGIEQALPILSNVENDLNLLFNDIPYRVSFKITLVSIFEIIKDAWIVVPVITYNTDQDLWRYLPVENESGVIQIIKKLLGTKN